MAEPKVVAEHADGFSSGGFPWGWSYKIFEDGLVEFDVHATTEGKGEKLVEKRVSLALYPKQIGTLIETLQGARLKAMERQRQAGG